MKKRGIWLIVSVLVVLGLLLGGFGCKAPAPTPAPTPTPTPAPSPAAPKVYNWRLQSILTPGFTEYDVLLPRFIERVKTMSEGQINITLYPASALVPTFESFGAVGKGVFEITHGSPGYWMGVEPVCEFAWWGPPSFSMLDQYEYFWWEAGMLDLMREVYAKHNNYYLCPVWSDEWGRVASTKPIYSLKDYDGMKVRSWGVFGDILKARGASIVSMPGAEIYTALATGVIDAANWGSPALNTAIKLEEVAKYYIGPTAVHNDMEDIIVNLDVWNALPDDLQLILEAAGRQFAIERTSFSIYESAVAAEVMKAAGVTFIYLPAEEVELIREEAIEGLRKKSTTDAYCTRAFKLIEEVTKDYGYLEEWFTGR